MSKTASWSYTNTATVKPFVSIDPMTQESIYGEEYQIACTWTAKSEQARDDNGAEFVSRHEIFTEDPRPKYLDKIQLNGSTEWEEIRSVTGWDMSPFGETPDYRLVT
nr:hypothetical protein [Gammaproteobacteria bacterium]